MVYGIANYNPDYQTLGICLKVIIHSYLSLCNRYLTLQTGIQMLRTVYLLKAYGLPDCGLKLIML